MYGAIIGDIVGSKYEFNNIKTKDFPFVSQGCKFTDDTVMTVAVAKAILRSREKNTSFKRIAADYKIDAMLPEDFVETIEQFDMARMHRAETYARTGFCSEIILE